MSRRKAPFTTIHLKATIYAGEKEQDKPFPQSTFLDMTGVFLLHTQLLSIVQLANFERVKGFLGGAIVRYSLPGPGYNETENMVIYMFKSCHGIVTCTYFL